VRPKIPFETGVVYPERAFGRFSVSDAALRSRFVVPSALVEPDRAEHTMATLLESM
jgi:hypothetical protein